MNYQIQKGGREVLEAQEENNNEVPLWERFALTIPEAAKLTGIGQNTLLALAKMPRCPFVLYVGRKRMVKREKLMTYLNNQTRIC